MNFFSFFFSSWKTKCTSRFFRKSSCMTVTQASVPVNLFHLSLSSAIKLLLGLLYLAFCTKQPATLAYSNRD